MRKRKDLYPDPYLWLTDPDRKAQKIADPVDPDPQHWPLQNGLFWNGCIKNIACTEVT